MRFFKYNAVIIFLLSFLMAAEAASNLPKHHPLREDRVVLDRPNSVRQFSYNVNKKFEGVSDRFGAGDLDGAMESLESMLEWNLSKYEKAVVYQFMGFVFVARWLIKASRHIARFVCSFRELSKHRPTFVVFTPTLM